MRFKARSTFVSAAAAALVISSAGLAAADSLADTLSMTGVGTVTVSADRGASVGFFVAEDGSPGCDVSISAPAQVSFDLPTGVSASPSSLAFTSCDETQTVWFSVAESTPAGEHVIQPQVEGGTKNISSGGANFRLIISVPPAPTDTTPPVITPSVTGTLGDNGWYTSDVTVSWNVEDGKSAVTSSMGCETQTLTEDTDGVTFTCSATSAGGTTTESVTVKRDATTPTYQCDEPSEEWSADDVTLQCSASDATSGLDGADSFGLSTDVAPETETDVAQTGTHTLTDRAGNSVTAGPIGGNKVDKKAPEVSWTAGPEAGAVYQFGDTIPTPACSAVDNGSGVAGPCSVSGFETTVGTQTMTATAIDEVGNERSIDRTYTVKPWTLNGFYRPVDMGKVNTVKAGSTVPLKFNVFKGDEQLTSGIRATFSVKKVSCSTGEPTDDIEEFTTTGKTELRYDPDGQQWVQNWATPKSGSGFCFVVTMTTADGTPITADFKLK